MTYVITDACTMDHKCTDVCPVDCIHPMEEEDNSAVTQLYINPDECIDCGACPSECEADAIFSIDELPADKVEFILKNKHYFG